MKGWREHGREWNFSEWLKNYNKVTMRTGLELVLTIKSILNVLVILYARWCVTLRPLRFTDSFRKNGRDIHNTGRFVKLKKKNKYKILESRIIIIIFFLFIPRSIVQLFDRDPRFMIIESIGWIDSYSFFRAL